MRNPANVKGTDLSSSYFPAPAYNGGNIEVSTSPYRNILNKKATMMFKWQFMAINVWTIK